MSGAITESFDTRYHLQSYFLLFNNAVLRAPKFRKFWEGMRYIENKRVVIFKYEIGLSQMLLKAGFRLRALNPYRQLTGAVLARLQDDAEAEKHPLLDEHADNVLKHINLGVPLNPTHYFWDDLVTAFQCPFIKRDLLEKNPVGIPLLGNWRTAIASDQRLSDRIHRRVHAGSVPRSRVLGARPDAVIGCFELAGEAGDVEERS